jgi:hypothetical protein
MPPSSVTSGSSSLGADQAREELDVLEALLEAKRTLLRVGEARAEPARRVEAHYERLFRGGMATEDPVVAARDDVLWSCGPPSTRWAGSRPTPGSPSWSNGLVTSPRRAPGSS